MSFVTYGLTVSKVTFPSICPHIQSVSLLTEKRKNIQWKRFKRSKLSADRLKHKDISRQLQTSLYRDKLAFENQLSFQSDTDSFFRYAKTVLKFKEEIPSLRRQDGTYAHSNT